MSRSIVLLAIALLFWGRLILTKAALGAADAGKRSFPEYYFWNEVTGDVQWEDPGGGQCLTQNDTH